MATAAQHVTSLASLSRDVSAWVDEVARLTRPAKSIGAMAAMPSAAPSSVSWSPSQELLPLNQTSFPGCYLHRSDPSDVARVEHLTFVCTTPSRRRRPEQSLDAAAEAHAKLDALFAGCMQGRTLYVVPYCMGPIDSPLSRCGVEITDSAYVVLNMRLMTRMGRPALERIARDGKFVKGLHSTGDLDPDRRFIMHFPEELVDQELRFGLRRQCAARQEMPCAAHRELAGAHRGLARRAHADRRASRTRRARPTTSPARSRRPAAKPILPC